MHKVEAEFYREVHELEKKYAVAYEPHFEKVSLVVGCFFPSFFLSQTWIVTKPGSSAAFEPSFRLRFITPSRVLVESVTIVPFAK